LIIKGDKGDQEIQWSERVPLFFGLLLLGPRGEGEINKSDQIPEGIPNSYETLFASLLWVRFPRLELSLRR
jgi:hypothetical protein